MKLMDIFDILTLICFTLFLGYFGYHVYIVDTTNSNFNTDIAWFFILLGSILLVTLFKRV